MCVKVKVVKHSIFYRGKPKTSKNGAFEMPRELAEKLISNGAHIEIIDSEEDVTELTYAVEENNSTESTYVFEENNDTEETVIIEENNDTEEKPKKKRRKKK